MLDHKFKNAAIQDGEIPSGQFKIPKGQNLKLAPHLVLSLKMLPFKMASGRLSASYCLPYILRHS
jgi:hypothetical protein